MVWVVVAALLVVAGLAFWFAHEPKPSKGDRDAQDYVAVCETLATIIEGVNSEDIHRALCSGTVGWRGRYAEIILADNPEEALRRHAPPVYFGAHSLSETQKACSEGRISHDAAKAVIRPFLNLSDAETGTLLPDIGRGFPQSNKDL